MDELLSPKEITSIKDDFPFIHWVKEGAKAQLTKCHRNRPERGKVADTVEVECQSCKYHDNYPMNCYIEPITSPLCRHRYELADQISALFPDIEQIRKDYDELILEMRREFDAKITLAKEIVREQAVREEQERIDNIITKLADENPECPVNLFLKDDIVRQALKEGEK